MNTKTLALAAALLLPLSAWSGDEQKSSDKPSISTSHTVQLSAVVEAIDMETRQVTLRGPEGNSRTLTVREDARNLDQVDVGDTVNVEYVQNLTIEVFANDGMEPGTGQLSAVQRAKEGEMPGMAVMDTSIVWRAGPCSTWQTCIAPVGASITISCSTGQKLYSSPRSPTSTKRF